MLNSLSEYPSLLLPGAVAVTIVLLAVVLLIKIRRSGKKPEPDYRNMLNIGVIIFVIGFTSENAAMWPLGIVLMVIGLANRNKWKEPRKWSAMSKREKKMRIGLVSLLVLLLLVGVMAYQLQ